MERSQKIELSFNLQGAVAPFLFIVFIILVCSLAKRTHYWGERRGWGSVGEGVRKEGI